ncbi:hypothetical protein HGRIS_003324 [Hohenbuehelia grisea]|uniref:Uncharacterized protein n=1 Tax=Hohenbuehelia grisea TaxID=104357 RepID=A0ABR3JGK2_9AGAR
MDQRPKKQNSTSVPAAFYRHNSLAPTVGGISTNTLTGLGHGLNPGGTPALRQVSDVSMRTAPSITSEESSGGTHPTTESSSNAVSEGVPYLVEGLEGVPPSQPSHIIEGVEEEMVSESSSQAPSSLDDEDDADSGSNVSQPFQKSATAVALLRSGLSHQEKTVDQMTDLKNELTHTKDDLLAAIRDSKAELREEMRGLREDLLGSLKKVRGSINGVARQLVVELKKELPDLLLALREAEPEGTPQGTQPGAAAGAGA